MQMTLILIAGEEANVKTSGKEKCDTYLFKDS
jgi:hypothetical protein